MGTGVSPASAKMYVFAMLAQKIAAAIPASFPFLERFLLQEEVRFYKRGAAPAPAYADAEL